MPTDIDLAQQGIEESRQALEARLHPSYLILVDAMIPLLEPWGQQPAQVHADAARRFYPSETSWRGAVPELMLQAQALEGDRVRAASSSALALPLTPRQNPAWWRRQIEQAHQQAALAPWQPRDVSAHGLRCASEVLGLRIEALQRADRHRTAALQLPERLADGDANDLQAWVDTVLAAIDPAVAREIRVDEPVLACLLADDAQALATCMDYVNLMVEAVPPHLHAHVAGPGAAHVLTQAVLCSACAFLGSPTAFAQTRHLAERLLALEAAAGPEAASAPWAAIKEFAEHLDEFTNAAMELHTLGELLAQQREPVTADDGQAEQGGWWRSVMRKVQPRRRH